MSEKKMMEVKRESKEQYHSYKSTYFIIAFLMTSVMTAVFFGMAMQAGGLFLSDTPLHIEDGIALRGYGLETVFIFLVGKVSEYPMIQLVFAIYETILVMATWTISQKMIKEFFGLDRRIVLAISTGLIFLTAIYIPRMFSDFYRQGLGTQPWHNSTYFGMRFIGLIYIMYLFRSLPCYLEGISWSRWRGMALALAISTMYKPNFLISVCVALGMILLIDLVRLRNIKTLKHVIIMGTTVFPSLAVLAIQYFLIYVNGNDNASGIEVVWFSDLMWNGTPKHMILKLFRQLAFVIVVLILAFRKKSRISINMVMSILLYIVSLAIFSMFKESGPRANDGNFGWSVPMGFYVMYLYTVPWFFRSLQEWYRERRNQRRGLDSVCYTIGIVLLAFHCVSGICYFGIIASGGFPIV